MQPLDDLLARRRVRGGGQGNARDVREALGKHGQADVFRTKVVPPLRHAVRLVYGK